MSLELAQESPHGSDVVAGAGEIAGAQHVGLHLLFAREALQIGLGAERRDVAQARRCPGDAAQHADNGEAQVGGDGLAVTLGRVAGRDVTDLVGQDTGHFRLVVGQGQKAAGNIDVTARQREGVDLVRIAKSLKSRTDDLLRDHEDLHIVFTGAVAEAEETKKRLIIGSVALMFALFALLAIPFQSILQPLYILIVVPFGVIGALLGHIIMDITPSDLSLFGILAMAGVVVNDSLVMVDDINQRIRRGVPLLSAVQQSGRQRFRPIFLTSVTTFVGLIPLMFDNSLQAQFLIPMAVSLAYGVLFATGITLFLIPCVLLTADDIGKLCRRFLSWYGSPFYRAPEQPALLSKEQSSGK